MTGFALLTWFPLFLFSAGQTTDWEEQYRLGVRAAAESRFPEAENHFLIALAIVHGEAGREEEEKILNPLVAALIHQGKFVDAERYSRERLKLARGIFGEGDSRTAQAMHALGEVLSNQATPYVDLLEKLRLWPSVPVSIVRSPAAQPSPGRADRFVSQKLLEAEDLLTDALKIYEMNLGSEHVNVGLVLLPLCSAHSGLKDYKRAEQECLRSIAILERAQGVRPDHVVQVKRHLGLAYSNWGKYVHARTHLLDCVAFDEKQYGPESAVVAWDLLRIARTYRLQKLYADADAFYSRVIGILEKEYGERHPVLVGPLKGHSDVLRKLDRKPEAREAKARAEAIERQTGAGSPMV